MEQRLTLPLSWTTKPPADREDLTHSGISTEHGKPVSFPLGKLIARAADNDAGRGRKKKRKPFGNRTDRG